MLHKTVVICIKPIGKDVHICIYINYNIYK